MRARWVIFAVGSWLLLAPLALGYASVGPVLNDVALGLVVCALTLASVEWPAVRFALPLPAVALVTAARTAAWGARPAVNELACGLVVLLLALAPLSWPAASRRPASAAV